MKLSFPIRTFNAPRLCENMQKH